MRLVSLEVTPRPELPCELMAWRLVGLLGEQAVPRASAARLATALSSYKPAARDVLDSRRRQLDAAVQGEKGDRECWFASLLIQYPVLRSSSTHSSILSDQYLNCLNMFLSDCSWLSTCASLYYIQSFPVLYALLKRQKYLL
ncbi:hypothetical protein EVAR_19819_1 [Eumeta japonica]|uniref:Uncharacterized protein n=1 Tax=Eumeta variegata TaxID=151549 RepID=A0A4C1URY5_EUMVA|nr:hypothetical protein EVAR_19819_1 [Eumeta japonica]